MKVWPAFFGLALWFIVPASALAAFGLTTATDTYTVDTGAGLIFKVRRTDNGASTQSAGDLMSLKYNGIEYQDQSRGSQLNSGFDFLYNGVSAVTVDAAVVNTDYVKITVTAGNLTHYYLARNGYPHIYMATYFTTEPDTLGLCRYIVRIPSNLLTNGPTPSDIRNNTGAIEASDIFGYADGTTRSKHYSNMRLKDWRYIGATDTNVGVWIVRDNGEGGSGGPFYRSLLNQCGSDQEITYIVNYGETQTEAFRTSILNGPYTMVFTDGSPPPALDTSWVAGLGLIGYVGAADRGSVTGSSITGRDTSVAYTVGFSNANAQYSTDAAARDGAFTMAGMIPGTYTMNVYKNELVVYTATVTVAAGSTLPVGSLPITADPSQAVPLWRIGNWDGSPVEFLNGDKVTTMHPSDVRMSSWTPGLFVVGSSTASTGMPCYQWKDVNANQVVQFDLTAAQIKASTVRVGITTAFAGARPNLKVNTTTTGLQGSSTQPDSRTLTVGSYRGNNTTYTFNIPANALVVGTNTLTVYPISGSSGTTYLSPGYSLDCLDFVQGSQTLALANAPATLTAAAGSAQVTLNWTGSPGATSYNLLRATTSGGPYTTVATGLTALTATDPGLADGTTYYYVVTASNSSGAGGYSTEASATPTALPSAPAITSALSATTQAGQPFSYQITASGSPTSFGATGLPGGLSVDPASGLITGTATQAGTFPVGLTATNAAGPGSATLTLVVTAAPVSAPVITSAPSATAKVGLPFTYQITATNNPASFTASGLPPGLSVDPVSGLISGTPNAVGTAAAVVSATNAGGTGAGTVTVAVTSSLPVITLSAAVPLVTAGTGEIGQFLLTRTGDDLSTQLMVAYAIKGSAVNGSDYLLLTGVKKMKPGKASVKIKVTPLGNGAGPGVKRTVVLVLTGPVPGAGYTTGTSGKVKVKIAGQ